MNSHKRVIPTWFYIEFRLSNVDFIDIDRGGEERFRGGGGRGKQSGSLTICETRPVRFKCGFGFRLPHCVERQKYFI